MTPQSNTQLLFETINSNRNRNSFDHLPGFLYQYQSAFDATKATSKRDELSLKIEKCDKALGSCCYFEHVTKDARS